MMSWKGNCNLFQVCDPLPPLLSFSLSFSLYLLKIILVDSTGERNHFQQMTQSLGKELKRVLKSSQLEVKQLSNELESQKEKYDVREEPLLTLTHWIGLQSLTTEFNQLKEAMEEETRKRQEEELQRSKGFFGRKKKEKETDAAPAVAVASK